MFILQNKNWNLVGFLIIANHMNMNQHKWSKIFFCLGFHSLEIQGCSTSHLKGFYCGLKSFSDNLWVSITKVALRSSSWSWAWIHGWSCKRDSKAWCKDKKRKCEHSRYQGITEQLNQTLGECLFTFQYSPDMNFTSVKRSTN